MELYTFSSEHILQNSSRNHRLHLSNPFFFLQMLYTFSWIYIWIDISVTRLWEECNVFSFRLRNITFSYGFIICINICEKNMKTKLLKKKCVESFCVHRGCSVVWCNPLKPLHCCYSVDRILCVMVRVQWALNGNCWVLSICMRVFVFNKQNNFT